MHDALLDGDTFKQPSKVEGPTPLRRSSIASSDLAWYPERFVEKASDTSEIRTLVDFEGRILFTAKGNGRRSFWDQAEVMRTAKLLELWVPMSLRNNDNSDIEIRHCRNVSKLWTFRGQSQCAIDLRPRISY